MNRYNFGDILEAVTHGVIVRGVFTSITLGSRPYCLVSDDDAWFVSADQIIGVAYDPDEVDEGWGQGAL